MTLVLKKLYNPIRALTKEKDAALPASSPTSFNDIHEHQLLAAQAQQESKKNNKKKNLLIKTKKRKKNAEQQLSQSGRTKTEMRE